MHTHAHDMLWRGAREGAGVDRSWPRWFWDTYSNLGISECEVLATGAYVDSLRCGISFLADHLREGLPSAPFKQALSSIGLAGRIHAFDPDEVGTALALPHETHPQFEALLEKAALSECRPIMLHAQETPHRLEHIIRQTGRSTIELLDDHGLLHPQTFLVHLCEYSDSDLHLISARGAQVVVTPTAEMKMGERTLDIEHARSYGLRLLLGTDGPAYNNSNDLWGDVKLAALLWARAHGPAAVRAEDILMAVTWHASEAVGSPSGRIQVGAPADLIFLDGETLSLQPLVREPFDNVAAQIVYSASRSDLRYVIAKGKLVVADGRCLTMDEAQIIATIKRVVRHHFTLHT